MLHKNVCVNVPQIDADVPGIDVRVQNEFDTTACLETVALVGVCPETVEAVVERPARRFEVSAVRWSDLSRQLLLTLEATTCVPAP